MAERLTKVAANGATYHQDYPWHEWFAPTSTGFTADRRNGDFKKLDTFTNKIKSMASLYSRRIRIEASEDGNVVTVTFRAPKQFCKECGHRLPDID